MKLYFFPGACCMSCHIALEESKTPFELVYVGKKADEAVKNAFHAVNPLGAVPALELADKKILTQNTAILEYIADQKPESGLLEKAGTIQRAETMLWLSLIASDLHKSFQPLFRMEQITKNDAAQADIKKWAFANLDKYLTVIDQQLQHKKYLASDHFSIADCYLYPVYQWTKHVRFPTDKFKAINRYSAMIAEMPAVRAVEERENKFR